MADIDRPTHWPLDPEDWRRIDEGLQSCDEADELFQRMRRVGLPAEAAEQACAASRGFLQALRQEFFPGHP